MSEKETLRAYLTDRIAETIREANPNIGDKSFDRARYYVCNIMDFIRSRGLIKPSAGKIEGIIKKYKKETKISISGDCLCSLCAYTKTLSKQIAEGDIGE